MRRLFSNSGPLLNRRSKVPLPRRPNGQNKASDTFDRCFPDSVPKGRRRKRIVVKHRKPSGSTSKRKKSKAKTKAGLRSLRVGRDEKDDGRDQVYSGKRVRPSMDLRRFLFDVENQRSCNGCGGFAASTIFLPARLESLFLRVR